ncbi:hypothetical protein ATCC90586_009337 [Pythium insidiosum]|nr:hypothetical protein ATCC90586_009337 [Pythium insidiosum]
MHSPVKNDKLIQEDQLEAGSDGIPEEIWEDIHKNDKFIYFSLMFLNASVLWAYYSCLSAQDFYMVHFSKADLKFTFLTTLVTAWPMVFGHLIQIVFGMDKRFSQAGRTYLGYCIFILMGLCIMIFSAVTFDHGADEVIGKTLDGNDILYNKGQRIGGILVLMCFGIVGFSNSLSEANYYTLAALFPVEKYTNAVQIGNVCAGIVNITLNTVIRLIVGGVHQKKSSTNLSFYLFFSMLIVVMLVAMYVYRRLMNLPCIRFLIERNDAATKENDLAAMSPLQNIRNLVRIFKVIWVPAIAQWLIFFVSLSVFPGFGCAALRNVDKPYVEEKQETTSVWYCAPGIIGSYNYGDFIGRILCTAAVYKILTMKLSFSLTVIRLAFIPLMLMGVAGTSFYAFGSHVEVSLVYNILMTLVIGITNGLLSTVTMGTAPRMLPPNDRESGGAVMVFFLFLGIASGAHFGFLTSDNGWLGL